MEPTDPKALQALNPLQLKEQAVNLADLRVRYSRAELTEADVLPDPLEQFSGWLREALEARVPEPNAMTLSTVDAAGQPSGRIVLLKGLRAGQFVFYTNYESQKARDLAANPRVGLTWHWHELERQVRVTGWVEKVTGAESAEYFHSRPRESQIGAWASRQSSAMSREALYARYAELAAEWDGQEVPVPDFWGGYAVTPLAVEFWQGRPSRLHDRIIYQRESLDAGWNILRLAP